MASQGTSPQFKRSYAALQRNHAHRRLNAASPDRMVHELSTRPASACGKAPRGTRAAVLFAPVHSECCCRPHCGRSGHPGGRQSSPGPEGRARQSVRRTCVDAPMDASGISGSVGHVIRCGRVSGLEDAACHAPRACMEICRSGPVRLPALDGAPSGMLVRPTRSLDRLPLRSLAPLTSGDNPTTPAYAAVIAGSL